MEVSYPDQFPPEIDAPIKAMVTQWLWLTPLWCQKLIVHWDASGRDDARAMDVTVEYEYRRVRICIYGGALDVTENRERHLVHELVHGFIAILADFTDDLIDDLIPKDEAPKYHGSMKRELRMRHESATQDLAFRIYERFAGEATK